MGAATSGSFISAYDNEREFTGGFEIRADSVAGPVADMSGQVRRMPSLAGRIDAVASQSVLFEKRVSSAPRRRKGPIRSTATTTPT